MSNKGKPKAKVIFRINPLDGIVLVVFPEIPANNVAANMRAFNFRDGFFGINELVVTQGTIPIDDHKLTLEVVEELTNKLSRFYVLERRKRVLTRYKLARHSLLYARDKRLSKELK